MNEATTKYLEIKAIVNLKRKTLTTLPDKYSSEGSMKYSSTLRITPLRRYIRNFLIVKKIFDYVINTFHECKNIRIITKTYLATHFPEISITK